MATIEDIPELDKLSMLDKHGSRMWIYAAEVKGFFRRYRDVTQIILIVIFMILPWIKIGGHQAVLLNIADRKFAIFGLTFFAHDGPLIFFLLSGGVFTLAFVTAVWGRVWCGWACPQTVFIDGLFRKIERWIEGTYLQRRALDAAPLSFSKFFKRSFKILVFLLLSSHIAHSFIAYFVGAEQLSHWTFSDPHEHWTAFLFTTVITGLIFFNFTWFREQFCIIACPYGRFQSVLYDKNTRTVMYDTNRGEPRKTTTGEPRKQTGDGVSVPQGDCVACNRCVNVCPTGIDIRNGVQMECIACTSCIDACDEIMTKVKKPTGLIRYASLNEVSFGKLPKILRPRTLVYAALALIAMIGLAYNIVTREPLKIQILRGLDSPYSVVESDPNQILVINHLRLNLHNETFDSMVINVDLPQELKDKGLVLKLPENPIALSPAEFKTVHFFISLPKATFTNGVFKIQLLIADKIKEVTLVGPLN
jgi:cytochrome c oxidase accessory protein FixG